MTFIKEVTGAKASKEPTGFTDKLEDQDIMDALDYKVEGFLEAHNQEYDWNDFLKRGKVKIWEPENLVDMYAFTKEKKGWLLKEPKEEWPELLKSEFSRDLSHILEKKKKGQLPPAITIDDEFADGRGRAMVQYSLGEKIPAVNFKLITSKKPSA